MVEDRTFALNFLYKIIDDNQATIRFLDTKAGFGIAILGTMVGKVILDQDQIKSCESHGLLIGLVAVFFGCLVLLTATLGFRTVFPTVNPAKNVTFPDDLEPKFFISKFGKNSRLKWFLSGNKFATLATTHAEYCTAVKDATQEKIESVLAAEVLKLSFIRQLKTDRLSAFALSLIVTVVLFVGLIFIAPKTISDTQTPAVLSHVETPASPCNQNFYTIYQERGVGTTGGHIRSQEKPQPK